MSERNETSASGSQEVPQKKGCLKFLAGTLGKVIISLFLFVVLLIGSALYFGGIIAAPYVKNKIRFVLGMESEWSSIDIDWFNKKVTIEDISIYQPEGFEEEFFFRAGHIEFIFNELSDPTEINLKELKLFRPELTWEFNKKTDSLKRFFEYLHSGKDTEEKYNYRID